MEWRISVNQLLHKQKLGDTDVSFSIVGSLNQGGNNMVGMQVRWRDQEMYL